jgi:transposase
VSRFVADNAHAIELFFLPPYAPELNRAKVKSGVWNAFGMG